jgi:hypothetical protein
MRDAFAWLGPPETPYVSGSRRQLLKWLGCNPWAFAWLDEPSTIELPDGTIHILR